MAKDPVVDGNFATWHDPARLASVEGDHRFVRTPLAARVAELVGVGATEPAANAVDMTAVLSRSLLQLVLGSGASASGLLDR
jgi:hypothetical protein